jgi:hypothetical protein
MNREALVRSGEGEFLPLTLPPLTQHRRGEFQMIDGGDFRVMFDTRDEILAQAPDQTRYGIL